MRRSGSSSCMLRPRSSLSDAELSSPAPSITMVNTRRLPRYSAERYYVLSELEMHSHSVRFLCDYDDDGIYAESLGAADAGGGRPPRNVILYLLWRADSEHATARAFADGPIVDCLRRLISLRGGDASALDQDETTCPPSPTGSGGDNNGANGFGGASGYGWPSSPTASPRTPLSQKSVLRPSTLGGRVSSIGNIAVLPTLEEPTSSSATKDAAAKSAKDAASADDDDDDDDDDDARKSGKAPAAPPEPNAGVPTVTPSPPVAAPKQPAILLPRRSSRQTLRRSPSAVLREQEEVLRSLTRTRVYIAVDRISPPARPNSDEGRTEGGGGGGADAGAGGGASEEPRSSLRRPEAKGAVGDVRGAERRAPNSAEKENKADSDDDDESSSVDPSRLRHHRAEVSNLAESLAKHVASSRRLRPLVDGICVGVASAEVRSACTPALEAALAAAMHGAPERRRGARYLRLPWVRLSSGPAGNRAAGAAEGGAEPPGLGDDTDAGAEGVDPSKSAVGICASHPDDLVGLDGGGGSAADTDASQGVLQSLTVAEWGGNGDATCFARRAMSYWRERHGLPPSPEESSAEGEGKDGAGAAVGRRKRRGRGGGARSRGVEDSDEVATAMVVAFLVVVAAYLWGVFGGEVRKMLMEKT